MAYTPVHTSFVKLTGAHRPPPLQEDKKQEEGNREEEKRCGLSFVWWHVCVLMHIRRISLERTQAPKCACCIAHDESLGSGAGG